MNSRYRILIFLGMVFTLIDPLLAKDEPKVKNGYLDLSNWDQNAKPTIRLDGEWNFYWQKLLSPDDLANNTSLDHTVFFSYPQMWNDSKVGDFKLNPDSYATYAMEIQLNDSTIGKPLVLSTWSIPNTYAIYLNDELVMSAGRPASAKEDELPKYGARSYRFKPEQTKIKLVIQTSSFHHPHGGSWYPVLLQTEEAYNQTSNQKVFSSVLVMGALIMMGFYHLGIWWLRAQDKSSLYFGLFCIAIGLRTLFIDPDSMGYTLFPNISFEWSYRLSIAPYYLSNHLYAMLLIHALDTGKFSYIIRGCAYLAIPFTFFALFVDPYIVLEYLPIMQLITVVLMIAGVSAVVVHFFTKDKSLFPLLLAFLVLFATVGHDLAASSMLINTSANLAAYGLLFYLFAQAYVLAKSFSRAFDEVAKQKREISKLNKQLTKHVEDLDKKIKFASKKLVDQEKKQPLNNMVETMSQEINNPLSIVTESLESLKSMKKGVLHDSELETVSAAINEATSRISHIVESFKSGPLSGDTKRTTFELLPIVTQLIQDLSLESKLSPEDIRLYNDDKYLDTTITADYSQIRLLFTHLIRNAIDAASLSSHPWVEIKAFGDGDRLCFTFIDSGAGVSEENETKIYEPFFSTKNKAEGAGLGLTICKSICEAHDSELSYNKTAPHTTFMLKLNKTLQTSAA